MHHSTSGFGYLTFSTLLHTAAAASLILMPSLDSPLEGVGSETEVTVAMIGPPEASQPEIVKTEPEISSPPTAEIPMTEVAEVETRAEPETDVAEDVLQEESSEEVAEIEPDPEFDPKLMAAQEEAAIEQALAEVAARKAKEKKAADLAEKRREEEKLAQAKAQLERVRREKDKAAAQAQAQAQAEAEAEAQAADVARQKALSEKFAEAKESRKSQNSGGGGQSLRDYRDLRQMAGNRPPTYPTTSRRLRHEGTVRLKYFVDASGHVRNVELVQSSGYPTLDREALQAVSRYKYSPGQSGWTLHPVLFQLKGPEQKMMGRLRRWDGQSNAR